MCMTWETHIMYIACRRSQTKPQHPQWLSQGRIRLPATVLYFHLWMCLTNIKNMQNRTSWCAVWEGRKGALPSAVCSFTVSTIRKTSRGLMSPRILEQGWATWLSVEGGRGPVGKPKLTLSLSSLGAIYSSSRLVLLVTVQAWEWMWITQQCPLHREEQQILTKSLVTIVVLSRRALPEEGRHPHLMSAHTTGQQQPIQRAVVTQTLKHKWEPRSHMSVANRLSTKTPILVPGKLGAHIWKNETWPFSPS